MKKNNQIWMIRAGEQGYLYDDFINKSLVAIGWNEIGDLKSIKNLTEIKDRLKSAYPDDSKGQIDNYAGQINRFRFEINKDELVITYNPSTRTYRIGIIKSDYEYTTEKGLDFYHVREVDWKETIQRDKLKTATKNSLGSTLTIFKLTGEIVNEFLYKEIKEIEIPETEQIESSAVELAEIKEDIEVKAREFIKDKILALDWEQMQEFIAGILRSMGYRSFISPKGMDRGRDIVASTDGLGLEDPKIVVEVKHRKGQMTSDDLRSFIGGLRPTEKGIYVSTGGFTKDAKYEAVRSDKPLTIVDSDRLVTLLIDYYDKFDVDTRLLVPLKKLYWPV